MPQQTKIFRVFVSSTFTDMKEERWILQKYVFPRLERYCLRNNAKFQAIDLRWGINEKTQLNQRTLQTCLNEIARCQRVSPKPNFLILLGDKYGWQPIPEKIPQDEMDLIFPILSEDQKKLLYWDEKNDYYRGWYRLDTNAIPSEFVLQERKSTFENYDKWEPVEKEIRMALRKAVDQLDFSDKRRIKYFTSATHQEIIRGALNPPDEIEDPNKHVFAFERVIKHLPEDTNAEGYIDLDGGVQDEYSRNQLKRLKVGKDGNRGLRKKLEDHYFIYNAEWINGGIEIERPLKYLAARVYCSLKSIIADQIENVISKDELQHEIKLHKDFKDKLVTHFRGRKEILETIRNYICDSNRKTLSIIGESGCGKSSVMAKAIQNIIDENKDVVLAYRFLGTSSNSSNAISLMQSVGEQIASEFNSDLKLVAGKENEKSLNEMYGIKEIFKKCLSLATPEKAIYVFLDALDQLSDTNNAKALNWLLKDLPENVKIIISSLPELENRLQDTTLQKLSIFAKEESKIILLNWLDAVDRTLTDEQFQYILEKPKITLAIYLKLIFKLIKDWHCYDKVLNISDTAEGIITDYFDNLENIHPEGFVEKVISYMLCGRYSGLAENEILEILVSDHVYWEIFLNSTHKDHRDELIKAKKIPVAVWSKLFLDMEPYLTEIDADGVPIFTFFHRFFFGILKRRYFFEEAGKQQLMTSKSECNKILADYFEKQPLNQDLYNKEKPNVRKLVELPWQQINSGSTSIINTLDNFDFIEAKLQNKMEYQLLEDFKLISNKYNEIDYNYNLVLSNLSNLSKYPGQLLNLLYFEGDKRVKLKVMDTFKNRTKEEYLLLTEKHTYEDYQQDKEQDCYKYCAAYKKEMMFSEIAFSPERKLLFYIKKLGVLGVIETIKGIEYLINIDISTNIPEEMYVSNDGNFIIFAYSDKNAIIYKLEYLQTESSLMIKGIKLDIEIKYFIPEFDKPVFYINNSTLLYQNENGDFVQLELINNKHKILISARILNEKSELAIINYSLEFIVVGFRHIQSSVLYILSANQIITKYSLNGIVQCSNIININEVVVFTLDKKLHHFKFNNDNFYECRQIALKEAPNKCITDNQHILVCLMPNHLYVYERQGQILPVINFDENTGMINELTYTPDGAFLIGTTNYFARFHINKGNIENTYEVISLLQNINGSHLALLNKEEERSLYDFKKKEIFMFESFKGYYISENLLAIDGEGNISHLWFEGFGQLFNVRRDKWIKEHSIPMDPFSIVGDNKSGFWIANEMGELFYMDSEGKWKIVFKISETLISVGALKVFDDILIWNGIILVSGKYGTDFKCQIRFFKIIRNVLQTTLKLIGTRVFNTHNGLVDSLCYDKNKDLYYVFLFSDKDENAFQEVRNGSINDFIQNVEQIATIKGLDQSIRYCHKVKGEETYYALGSQNTLFLLDFNKFSILSVLRTNPVIKKTILNPMRSEPLFISLSNSNIFSVMKINNKGD
ncbi:MAG: DUF4062 domain-containing protein [Candidatus Cloacimonetes bacterium]|nr:DUF4062 domain-containing protein [Candidatus Cloacimonadota bacterium]